MPATAFWIMKGDVPAGPFTVEQIHAQLAIRELARDARACPVGGNAWTRLDAMPGFEDATEPGSSISELVPAIVDAGPGGQPINASGSVRPPWNPGTIGLLGYLFSPLWAGVMMALNAKRLDIITHPHWVPLGIGFGYFVVDAIVGRMTDSVWGFVAVWVGANVLLLPIIGWQIEQFEKMQAVQPRRKAWWVLPILCGFPIGYVTFAGAAIPLQPREICQRFLSATTAQERAKYTITDLHDALREVDRNAVGSVQVELIQEESMDLSDVGTHLIPWCESNRTRQWQGVISLTRTTASGWKISDAGVYAIDGITFEPPLELSKAYSNKAIPMLAHARPWFTGSTLLRGISFVRENK